MQSDAGWGSPVAPTFIGASRPEADEFACDAVGLRFFHTDSFARKK